MIESYNVYLPKAQIIQPHAATDKTAVRKAAEEFESMFITEMLRPMFEETDEDIAPMFGGSHGEEMFKSLLTDEYGKAVAKAGGLGIADSIEAQMLKYQEVK